MEGNEFLIFSLLIYSILITFGYIHLRRNFFSERGVLAHLTKTHEKKHELFINMCAMVNELEDLGEYQWIDIRTLKKYPDPTDIVLAAFELPTTNLWVVDVVFWRDDKWISTYNMKEVGGEYTHWRDLPLLPNKGMALI